MSIRFYRKVGILVLVLCLIPHLAFTQAPQSKKPEGIDRLKAQIEQIVRGLKGEIGVAVKHLETGEELSINGDTYFPMASVFKIPILVETMAQVKEGRFTLDDEISLKKNDLHFGSGILNDLDAPGITLSIHNLINLMMFISDNSATDILLEMVGPENVNRRLRSYGLEKITVNRTCHHLIMDFLGMDYEKYKNLPLEEAVEALRKERRENPEAFKEATKKFSQVIKDQSSPRAMNHLLELIFTKHILDEESCEFIIDVMLRCQTGERRLKGDLPGGVEVAHKTGTIGGTVNDAGIIYLPYDLGYVAITVFTKDTEDDTEDVEDVIAQIARFVYDYFTFTL
ncbi:MAG: class A beta-lactamase [Candidatus Aminicenantales bacterium]